MENEKRNNTITLQRFREIIKKTPDADLRDIGINANGIIDGKDLSNLLNEVSKVGGGTIYIPSIGNSYNIK